MYFPTTIAYFQVSEEKIYELFVKFTDLSHGLITKEEYEKVFKEVFGKGHGGKGGSGH